MKKKIFLFLLLFIPLMMNAKEIEKDWDTSWGGDSTDTLTDYKITLDDGIIVCGSTKSTSIPGTENIEGKKIFLSKFDKNGQLEWQKFFSENEYSIFRSVEVVADRGYLVKGTIMNDTRDAIIILFDFEGNIVWTKVFKKNGGDIFIDIIQADNDSFIVTGTTSSTDIEEAEFKGGVDVLIVKYDYDGNIIYKKTWGTEYYDEITYSYINNKSELVICGTSTNAEGYNVYGADSFLLKYDLDGNLLTEKSFGGDGRDSSIGFIPYSDDSFLVILSSNSTSIGDFSLDGNFHTLLARFDENANLLWIKDIGITQNISLKDYVLTDENELVILMSSNKADFNNIKNKGKYDSIIMKFDKNFNIVFQEGYGGNGNDVLSSFYVLHNKQIIAIGYTSSTDLGIESYGAMDGVIVYFDSNGEIVSQQSYGGSGDDALYYIIANVNNLYMYGLTKSEDIDGITYNGGNQDILLLKYSLMHNIESIVTEHGVSKAMQRGNFGYITSTPDNGYEIENIIVKDISGNEIDTIKLEDGTHSFPIRDDVTVKVLFKETLENPKTGVISYIGLLISMLICSFLAFWFIMKKDNKYEL